MRLAAIFLAVALVGAAPAVARPVITEVAWGGDPVTNSGTDEWIEIFNPDAQPIDLGGFTLLGAGSGAATIALPAVQLADGEFFIVENTAAVPSSDGAHSFVSPSVSLTDSGEALCLCPTGTATCGATCDIANAGAAWFAGKNTTGARKTMERISPASDGALDASWQDGSPSSPLAPSPAGATDAGVPEADAGFLPDAGPNAAPTVSVTAPSGNETAAVVTVVYSASDADVGDDVAVDLYWSADASGNAGVRFAQGLPGGAGRSFDFDTAGVPGGTYHVFAAARDTRGAVAFAYAPGTVTVAGGAGLPAALALTEPDGVNDAPETGSVAVAWNVELPAGDTGTVNLFLDTDGQGADGVPLEGALSASADGPRAFVWRLDGVPAGEHFVYGVLVHEGTDVVAYAPASVTVPPPGCTCTDVGSPRALGLLPVATLAILLTRLRRRRG